MNEADCKGSFVKALREALPHFVVFRHEDHFTHGLPDISVTGNGRTSWIEAKYANPSFKSKGIQNLNMRRLAKAGIAFYVVFWYNVKVGKRTYVVSPENLDDPPETWDIYVEGFDYKWLVEVVKQTHQ